MHWANWIRQIAETLHPYYTAEEARSIARLLLEDALDEEPSPFMSICLSASQHRRLSRSVKALKASKPIQHVLGYAYFLGRKFKVTHSTFIPRQETELLVKQVADEAIHPSSIRVLDVGTGTGCVAVSLAHLLVRATVHALDNQKEALSIARKNARKHRAAVYFFHHDMNESLVAHKPEIRRYYDVVVSNPPYVCWDEKRYLSRRVLRYDPHGALFAPSADPLFHYRRLIQEAPKILKAGGKIYLEAHERHAKEVCALLRQADMDPTALHQDLHGKDRIVTGKLPY